MKQYICDHYDDYCPVCPHAEPHLIDDGWPCANTLEYCDVKAKEVTCVEV